MKRKVLLLCEPGKDGAFSYVRSVIENFHRYHPDIQVDYFYSSRRAGPGLEELVESVRSHGGVAWDMKVGNFPGLGDLRVLLKVTQAYCIGDYLAIHSNCSKAGAIVRVANLLFRRKNVLYSPHAFYGMAGRGGCVEFGFNLIEKVLRSAGHTIFSSDDERQFAIRKLGYLENQGTLVYNGIDTAAFPIQDPAACTEARARFGIPAEAKVLLTIGRESYQKNLQSIYEQLPALHRLVPELYFIHLGKGGEELCSLLPSESMKRVHHREFTTDLRSYFMASDAFIMVSRYEGLSLSMLLALSTGIPMILTRAPGMNLLYQFGFDEVRWIDHPDSAEYARSLEATILDWASTSSSASPRQRELAMELFDEKRQFRKLMSCYGIECPQD